MSWDVVVAARLRMNAEQRSAWGRATPTPVRGLPKTFPSTRGEPNRVSAFLDALARARPLVEQTMRDDVWTFRGLLSEDEYDEVAASLVDAVAAAHALGARGAITFLGWVTAPRGIAHLWTLGDRFAGKRLSKREEAALRNDPYVASVLAWIDDAAEALADHDEKASVRTTTSGFFGEARSVRRPLEGILSIIQSADDDALRKILGRTRLYHLSAYDTPRALKKASRSNGGAFESPVDAMAEMIDVAQALAPERVVEIGRAMLEIGGMPGALWEACARVLAPTRDGPRVLASFVPPMYFGASGLPGPWVRHWIASFGASPTITDEMLLARFRACVSAPYPGSEGWSPRTAPYTDDTAAVIVAGALLLHRAAWTHVREIAAARFDHPYAAMRRALGSLFGMVRFPVDVPRRPLVEYLADDQLFHSELARDPKRAFHELRPLVTADHVGLVRQLRGVDGETARRLTRVEPRWRELLQRVRRTARA